MRTHFFRLLQDVAFDVLFCGICHTDVHFVKELAVSYPLTPGHEIAGVVTKVGRNVTKLRAGDNVAVGCMVDSCFGCRSCRAFEEQYCLNGAVQTYGGETKYGRAGPDGAFTHGGYSDALVVNQRFCFKLPPDTDADRDDDAPKTSAGLAKYAPLLCAGVTTFDPLVRYGCVTGHKRVGVCGFGGLGMMAVKLAVSMQCDVVVLSTSPNKREAAKKMGASDFWVTTDEKAMAERLELAKSRVATKEDFVVHGWQHPDPLERTPPSRDRERGESVSRATDARVCLDVILDTVSAPHDVSALVDLLAPDGTLVLLGLDAHPVSLPPKSLVFSRRVVRGSLIAGTKSTEACLEWCASRGVFPEVRVIGANRAADALKALDEKNDAAVRYVIDCATIPRAAARETAKPAERDAARDAARSAAA